MKRVVSLWLPSLATDRLSRRLPRRERAKPRVTVTAVHGGMRLAAASPAARAAGLSPGMPLADARALLPGIEVHHEVPTADARMLLALARICTRFTPWTAVDGAGNGGRNGYGGDGGVWLDITGCAHLFGGEPALLARLTQTLSDLGFAARAGLADTPGAAWALARFAASKKTRGHKDNRIAAAAPGDTRTAIAPLPVAGLRLDDGDIEGLQRMGLRHIGDLYAMPRAPLAARFGARVGLRLDQALGRVDETLSPLRPPPDHQARLAFAEPIGRAEDIAHALARLLDELAVKLEKAALGARRVELTLYRVDGSLVRARIGTGRPTRDVAHLGRLFADRLDGLDPGFGIEVMAVAALAADPLRPSQMPLAQGDFTARGNGEAEAALLIDRLAGRFGPHNVTRLAPAASHIPERASRAVPATSDQEKEDDWRRAQPRPLQLLGQPMPIEVMAPVPDGPPVLFRWRRRQHKVARAEGPERIAPEWWRRDSAQPRREVRDYYRVEDSDGVRYWIYREGLYRPDRPPVWYLHGFFA